MDQVAGFTAKELEEKLTHARALLEASKDPKEREAFLLMANGYQRLLQCFSRDDGEVRAHGATP